MPAARYSVEPTHPALAGHFPGNPIVPAVLILAFVAATLDKGGQQLHGIKWLKFFRPVLPGEVIEVVCGQSGSGGPLQVTVDGQVIAKGEWH